LKFKKSKIVQLSTASTLAVY